MLLCATMVWAAYSLMKSMPFWPIDVTLTTDPWLKVQLDMVRCLWAVLPAAILWGASFPLALASVAARGQDPGRLVGGVYAANTFGAILGSLGASMVYAFGLGSQHSQQVLIAVSAISGLLMLALPSEEESSAKSNLNFGITVLCLAIAGGLLVMSVPELPGHFVAYGRFMPTRGANANIVVYGRGNHRRGCRFGYARRHAQLSQCGKSSGVERSGRHAAPAHAGTSDNADSRDEHRFSGDRIWRRRYCRGRQRGTQFEK